MRKFFESVKGKSSSKVIKCLACLHNCIIQQEDFGLCGARKNENGKIRLVTHSHPTSVHLDPIEKKPLFHFLPGTSTLSIGFYGCNFRCEFCQNFDISSVRGSAAERAINSLEKVTPKDFVSVAKKDGAKSIAFTYNEPGISAEYNLEAIEIAKKLKGKEKMGTVYVSNGYETEEQIIELNKPKTRLDAINIDLKSFNSEFYKKTCGAELEGVLKTIKSFHKKGIWLELTTLVIPGKNDSKEELSQIASFIYDLDKTIPWHVTAFFPTYHMTNVPPTSSEELLRALKIGKEKGLEFVYGGNVLNENENTICPKCNNLLIKRKGYSTEVVGLEKNKCNNCGTILSGVFG